MIMEILNHCMEKDCRLWTIKGIVNHNLICFDSLGQLNTRYSEHRTCVTGDGQRRGARRNDGVSLSDEHGPKNGFGKPLCNESAVDKGTCSRAPEDLGAALRCTGIGTSEL